MASDAAYLAALEALKALFLWEGLTTEREMQDKLKKVYKILHIDGYYRELQSKKAIDDGFNPDS